MGKFGLILAQEILRQQVKKSLMEAKGHFAEAHNCLREHQKHQLADRIYSLMKETDELLNEISLGRTL